MTSIPKLLRVAIAVVTAWTIALPPVRAGGSADERVGLEKFGEAAVRELALRVNDALDLRKANVAIVARCGRPRSELPKGIRYTHVAFAVFEPLRGSDGEVFYSYAVYNLYQGADGRPDRSYLKQDLTYDFVAGVAERDVAVCIPAEELQKRIVGVIRSPAYSALHRPEYNLTANPWVDRYDNCVTHLLKVCVAAIYQTDDRARIYRNVRAHFKPTRLRMGPLKTLGSHFVEELSWKDAEPEGLQTATYTSLVAFLQENGLVQEAFEVRM